MPAKQITTKEPAKSATNQLWYGENQSLIEVELKKWLELFRAKYPHAEVKRFEYGANTEPELTAALHQALKGNSLFAKKTFLVIINALAAEAKSDLAELIRRACAQASPDYILVLVEGKKVVWSKPLPKALKQLADVGLLKLREFMPLSLIELEKWIGSKVREQGGLIASAAARLLAQAVDNDFIALENEIAKLIAYRQNEEIRAVDVTSLVTPKLKEDTFAFIEAVGRRDMSAAQTALLRQLQQGVSPQNLIGLLAWHVRVLALVRQALDAGHKSAGARELAAETGLHPYVVTRALQQIPYYSSARIAWLYSELSELDIKLKSTATDPQALFGLFLSKLGVTRVTV